MASKWSVSEAFETDAPSRELSAGLAIATTFLYLYDGQRRLLGLLGHLQIIIIVVDFRYKHKFLLNNNPPHNFLAIMVQKLQSCHCAL